VYEDKQILRKLIIARDWTFEADKTYQTANGRVRYCSGAASNAAHRKSYDIYAFSFLQVGTSNHSVG